MESRFSFWRNWLWRQFVLHGRVICTGSQDILDKKGGKVVVFIHDLFCCVLKFEGSLGVENRKGWISHVSFTLLSVSYTLLGVLKNVYSNIYEAGLYGLVIVNNENYQVPVTYKCSLTYALKPSCLLSSLVVWMMADINFVETLSIMDQVSERFALITGGECCRNTKEIVKCSLVISAMCFKFSAWSLPSRKTVSIRESCWC